MDITPLENIHPWWNVIATAREDGFRETKRALHRYGAVERTHFFNVVVAQVGNIRDFLHDFLQEFSSKPYLQDNVSRIRPLMHTFIFDSGKAFETKVKDIIAPSLSQFKEKSFHVRINRRGAHEFSALTEEQVLNNFILFSLQTQNQSAKVDFTDPDFIIDVETIDKEGGVSIWTRNDLKQYPFLNIK